MPEPVRCDSCGHDAGEHDSRGVCRAFAGLRVETCWCLGYEMQRDARISECGTYRWTLSRTWDSAAPIAWWVMLNPSTADADIDDPTIRRCIAFSKREGCGGLIVSNLYSLRATDPAALAAHVDPVGSETTSLLVDASYHARAGGLVVLAWGAHPMATRAARSVDRMFHAAGAKCLGLTKSGQPRHPLYVRADQPMVPWCPNA